MDLQENSAYDEENSITAKQTARSIILEIIQRKIRYFAQIIKADRIKKTVQGVPKNCASFVWLLWRSCRFDYLSFYIVAYVKLQLRV